MNARVVIAVPALVLGLFQQATAWDADDRPLWPNGTVTLHLQLGSSPAYSDGTNPNDTAALAIPMWNPYMSRVQLAVNKGSGAGKSFGSNTTNNVYFDSKVLGENFPTNVLAVAIHRYSNSVRVEADVIVNSGEQWDSYRGSRQYPRVDLRRVIGHEIGHVLGLDHPDEAGQFISALMNSHISSLDTTAKDDHDGVAALYGHGVANPPVPPSIPSDQPDDVRVTAGWRAEFVVYPSGSAPFTYQWKKGDAAIVGATFPLFVIASATPADAGTYSVVVTNSVGSATSRGAVLTVNPPAPPSISAGSPPDRTATAGDIVNFDVSHSGDWPFSYQWRKNGVAIPGATNKILALNVVNLSDTGNYSVVVSNLAGAATSREARLTVNPAQPPTITHQPQDTTAIIGNSAAFSVGVSGTYPLTYQWFKNGTPISGSNSSYLNIYGVSTSSAGSYHVEVHNIAGSAASEAARLDVSPLPAPQVVRLSNQTVQEGSSLNIDFYESGSGTTHFQWYRNGVAIPGAFQNSFRVAQARLADAGEYLVVVTNATGSTTSHACRVSVVPGSANPVGGWIQCVRSANIVYFLFENPARIDRFDLNTDTWMVSIPLPRTPVWMAIHSDYIYMASGMRIDRYALDGASEMHLLDTTERIYEMIAHAGYLYFTSLNMSVIKYRLNAFDLSKSELLAATGTTSRIGKGFSVDAANGRLFCRTNFVSPSDITSIAIHSDGTIGTVSESPYHGAYPDARRTFVFPDGGHVVDESGTIYRADDLTYAGSLGGPFQDVAFGADGCAIAVRGALVSVYDAANNETGTLSLQRAVNALVADRDDVVAFAQPSVISGAVTFQRISLSLLQAPQPAPAVNPMNLAYAPDDVWLDRDGNVLLLSRLHRNIFRWSSSRQGYLSSIPLVGHPNFGAYSSENNCLYLGYSTGAIRVLTLSGEGSEHSFTNVPIRIDGLATAGAYVFLNNPSGSRSSFVTFAHDGTIASIRDFLAHYSRAYVWNATKRRVYHFRDDTSPNDLLYTEVREDGTIGEIKDSPYHGEISVQPPIRISPNGENILLGSGRFYNADTLSQTNALANELEDAAWLGTTVFTGRSILAGVELQRWGGSNYQLDKNTVLPGRVLRLFTVGPNRILAVTMFQGRVAFTLLNQELVVQSHATDAPDTSVRLANISTRAEVQPGSGAMIAGFALSGSEPKEVLVRATGPSLEQFGVGGRLANPRLQLFNQEGVMLVENDDWSSGDEAALRSAFAAVGAFDLEPGSLDAALKITLAPGLYTAHVAGAGSGSASGVALVEVYDMETAAPTRLFNISTRAQVGSGAKLLIPGIVVSGTSPKRLLVRAVGPTLAGLGVSGSLSDPRLEILAGDGTVIASNDDWWKENVPALQAAEIASGAFPLDAQSKDAAIVFTLDPGEFTVRVSGANNSTGVALVEVFEIP